MRDVTGGNAPTGANDDNGGVTASGGTEGIGLGPTCAACDDRYPEGAVHESCAGARIFDEGAGWLFLGRTVPLEEMPG